MTFPFPMFCPSSAAVLTTLTQVLSGTDNSGAAFTLPVGIQAGDLIVTFDFAASSASVPTTALASNFTQISNVSNSIDTRAILSYKIAVGTEGGTSVNGMNGNVGEAKLTYVFRGDIPITTATPTDVAGVIEDTNPSAQTVNASGGTPPLIVIGCYASLGDVSPRSFSTTKDGEINVTDFITGAADAWLAYKIYNSSPADTNIDMDDEGDLNTLISCYLACA